VTRIVSEGHAGSAPLCLDATANADAPTRSARSVALAPCRPGCAEQLFAVSAATGARADAVEVRPLLLPDACVSAVLPGDRRVTGVSVIGASTARAEPRASVSAQHDVLEVHAWLNVGERNTGFHCCTELRILCMAVK
jgi:hypothetical protein